MTNEKSEKGKGTTEDYTSWERLQYASTLADVKRALRPDPLSRNELDFWEETSDARDEHHIRREEIADILDTPENVKVLLTGHPGCGKSTELVKFQDENARRFAYVPFSVLKEAQLSQASIEVLLVLIVEATVRELKLGLNVDLSEETLELIYGWFSETFQIEERDLRFDAAMGADAGTVDTWWGKLLGLGALFKAEIKTGSHSLNRIVSKERHRSSELAYQCGFLLREARLVVKESLGRELLLIVEDLDKIPMQAADEMFIRNPAPLAELPCKTIYTAPIWLLANPLAASLDASFKRVNLPMIRVQERDGSPNPGAHDAIVRILKRRMDLALIQQEGLDLAIEKTAGVLRHLFDVLLTASRVARAAVRRGRRDDERIEEDDVRYGLNQLRSDLVRRVGVFGLPEEYLKAGVTEAAMFEVLRDLAERPRRLDSSVVSLLLLFAHAVIEYGREGWHRVHPLIAEHLETEVEERGDRLPAKTRRTAPSEPLRTLSIAKLELRNIRCFGNTELDLSMADDVCRWVLCLGDNGEGKTTLLRSIAMGLCDEAGATALMKEIPGEMLRDDSEDGCIRIAFSSPEEDNDDPAWIETRLTRDDRGMVAVAQKTSESFSRDRLFATAYGARRQITGAGDYSGYSLNRAVQSLFDYEAPLFNPELALRRIADSGFDVDAILRKIDSVLMLPEGSTSMRDSGIVIDGQWGDSASLGALADGYHGTLAWIADLLGWALAFNPAMLKDSLQGIVLIDEIELHLHPRWQRHILSRLQRQFPNIQFFVTTHSPCCAGGLSDLESDNAALFRLRIQEERSVTAERIPSLAGLRYDQIATSSAFGLSSARDLTTEDLINRVREASSLGSESDEFKEAFSALETRSVVAAQDEETHQTQRRLIKELEQVKDLMRREGANRE